MFKDLQVELFSITHKIGDLEQLHVLICRIFLSC